MITFRQIICRQKCKTIRSTVSYGLHLYQPEPDQVSHIKTSVSDNMIRVRKVASSIAQHGCNNSQYSTCLGSNSGLLFQISTPNLLAYSPNPSPIGKTQDTAIAFACRLTVLLASDKQLRSFLLDLL